MSYTIGFKRKFWFGFSKYLVNTHYYDGPRFVIETPSGEQISFPELRSTTYKVYPDVWDHHRRLESAKAAESEREAAIQIAANKVAMERLEKEKWELKQRELNQRAAQNRPVKIQQQLAGAQSLPEFDDEPEHDFVTPSGSDVDTLGHSHVSEEAKRNAATRVRGILQSDEFVPPARAGSPSH